ncbi:Chloride channel protein [Streptococcus sp. DD10]|uniref:chloride channel protein n=1 Tax=Streptococcus sp. DD10 TaxID=1777878 RepID=UPI0007939C50|nr:chloride channel protein [Streptococcus sp. DD10]KXT76860.1 Chloride channel protein [Streptococcus sp. DD10]
MKKIKEIAWLTLLALVIGILVGGADTLFGQGLLWLSDLRGIYLWFLLPFLPIAGLFLVYLYQCYGGISQKGMTLVFEVGHGTESRIPKRLIPLVIFSTWLTHLFGGSAGREGVAVQLGATISHWFSRYFPTKNASKIFLLMGMGAGFAGLFQTPFAATFFALEVLVVGELALEALYPTLVASFLASWTSHRLGLEKFSWPLTDSISFTPLLVLQLLLLGFIFWLTGKGFALLLTYFKKKSLAYLPNPYQRIFLFGIILSLALFLLHSGRYTGLGTNLIETSFAGGTIYFYDWFLKLLLTTFTIAIGYQGGEVTPLFAIGASLGVVLALLLGLPLSFVAALGYVAVFSSATSTLWGPSLIGCEIFGWTYFPYFFLVCFVARFFKKEISIYGAQKVILKQNK